VQLQDISAWGNGTEVAQLLLPRSARIQRFDKAVIPLPPKDTRTVKGIVEVPPLTIYRFVSLFCVQSVMQHPASAPYQLPLASH
jgi:hypothetical protein